MLEGAQRSIACLGVILSFLCQMENKELDETYKVSSSLISDSESLAEGFAGDAESIVEDL
jgi:hypothetical protein